MKKIILFLVLCFAGDCIWADPACTHPPINPELLAIIHHEKLLFDAILQLHQKQDSRILSAQDIAKMEQLKNEQNQLAQKIANYKNHFAQGLVK